MRRSFPKNKKQLQIAAVALTVGLGLFIALRPGGSGSTDKAYGVVKRQELVQRVTVAGTVIPKKRTVIMPPYTGYIKHIYVHVGEPVKMGDPIVSVVQTLNASGEIYPIRSPFPGTVVQVLRSDGEYVEEKGENNVIVRVDDLSELFIIADAPELDMVKVKVGQEVVVKASAVLTRSYKGVVQEISLSAREKKDWWRSNEKVEFPVRVKVTDQDSQLKTGMSCLIDIIAAKKDNVLTLRHEFIQKIGDQYFVIRENGTRQDISVGLQNEEMFEITGGLNEGDKVKQTDFTSLTTEG